MAFYMKVHGENPKNTSLKALFPKNSPETLHRGVLGGGSAGVAPGCLVILGRLRCRGGIGCSASNKSLHYVFHQRCERVS